MFFFLILFFLKIRLVGWVGYVVMFLVTVTVAVTGYGFFVGNGYGYVSSILGPWSLVLGSKRLGAYIRAWSGPTFGIRYSVFGIRYSVFGDESFPPPWYGNGNGYGATCGGVCGGNVRVPCPKSMLQV